MKSRSLRALHILATALAFGVPAAATAADG